MVLRGVRYTYPGASVPALVDVDLDVGPGLTLVRGDSGSGKSTLLRLGNGLIPHFHGGIIAGRALVFGRDVSGAPTRELARLTGFVFQDPELQAVYARVDHDIAFGLENLGVPRTEMRRRVDEAMHACGIAGVRERAVSTLSGGERQRAALAGVLAMRPRLLVLDEPLSQLDDDGADAVMAALDDAVRGGATVMIAEHRAHAALDRARLVVAIAGGTIIPAAPADASPSPDRIPPRPAGPRGEWEVHDLVAGNNGAAVLHGVNLGAGAGEVIALAGRNGSGKTTLLRTIAGLAPPLAGLVRRAPGRVAYLPQNPTALLHRETVRDEIAWTLRQSRTSGSRAAVDAVLHDFGLLHVAERYPRDLSTGERQRTALAAVLAGDPRLALLDEPTRGMDAAAREALAAAVARIANSGGSVVIATHDAVLASSLATRVVEVRDGACREVVARTAVPA